MLEAANWVFIMPIKVLLSTLLNKLISLLGSPGLAIVALSLVVNTLLLPVWRWSEALQQRERTRLGKMQHYLQAVRHAFRGETRFTMIRTVHRIHGYRPYFALHSSVGLLLQLPFFIAAYQLLGHLEALKGLSFGPLSDLSQADALLSLGALHINLLPLLMTLLNLLASLLYTDKLGLRDRIQLYLMALLFLLLLYASPSALLLYWSCNNAFSLIKLLLLRVLKPSRPTSTKPLWQAVYRRARGPLALQLTLLLLGLMLALQYLRIYRVNPAVEATIMLCLLALALYYALLSFTAMLGWPLRSQARQWLRLSGSLLLLLGITYLLASFSKMETDDQFKFARRGIFVLLASMAMLGLVPRLLESRYWPKEPQRQLSLWVIFLPWITLSLLTMLQAPAALLSSSPDEGQVAFGWLVQLQLPRTVCLLLAGLIFTLLISKRYLVALLLNALLLLNLFNAFVPLGNYDKMVNFTIIDLQQMSVSQALLLLDMGTLIAAPLLVAWLLYRHRAWLRSLQLTALLVVASSTVLSFAQLQQEKQKQSLRYASTSIPDQPIVLSRNSPNVLVLMLDSFVGPYLADILQEDPSVAAQLDGFRWYRNTISVGGHTLDSIPAIFGGYGYTLDKLKQQKEDIGAQKIDQAYRVLPRNFAAAGFRNLIIDPQHAGGLNKGDCQVFSDIARSSCYQLNGHFTERLTGGDDFFVQNNLLATYGSFRVTPASLRMLVYAVWAPSSRLAYRTFIDSWSVLDSLPRLSHSDDGPGTFMLLNSMATHDPQLSYNGQPAIKPQTRAEDLQKFHGLNNTQHYYVARAVVHALLRWFSWMQQEGVYDNTRIILVSDHGYPAFSPYLQQQHGWQDDEQAQTRMRLLPLLLLKDFQQRGQLIWDPQLASNADTPYLAMSQIIAHPIDADGQALEPQQQGKLPLNFSQALSFLNVYKQTQQHLLLLAEDAWQPESWKVIK